MRGVYHDGITLTLTLFLTRHLQKKSRTIILVVVGLGGAVILGSLIRSLACFALTIRASKRLHDAMTESVLRAKIVFFDTNPSGRFVPTLPKSSLLPQECNSHAYFIFLPSRYVKHRILNRFSADVGSNDDL